MREWVAAIRQHPSARVLALFVVWWIILQGFALLAFNRFRLTQPDTAYAWTAQPSSFFPVQWHDFAEIHARWDSGFYQWIAHDGYVADNAAFFPLYPALIRAVSFSGRLWGQLEPDRVGLIPAAFIVSNVAALGAALALYKLARLDLSEAEAQRGLFYFLIFPTAFFLTTNYTESLFILWAVLSFYFARQGRWLQAGLVGALAMLTRATAVALAVGLMAEWWTQRHTSRWRGLWLLLIPLAFALFVWYLQGQGLSFFEAQLRLFGRSPINLGALWPNLDWAHVQVDAMAQANLELDLGIGVLVLIGSLLVARRWRWSYGLYGVLCIMLPLISGSTISLNRYALAAFPVPLMLVRNGHSGLLQQSYTIGATLLLALYTALFVQGYWAG
ncbi:MAG TPA: mannosyltransferase family protein [Anaerolineae bacterium]|nr:mannosyltransferase family protein [Anaerolineae bacterium]